MVPIATYGYRLWFFDGACNKGAISQLKWMQQKAALWITGAFRTSPTGGLEALAGIISVHLMLKKGSGSASPAPPPTLAGSSSSLGGGASPISPDPTLTRATYSMIVLAQSCHMLPHRRSRSTTGSIHSSKYESDSGTAQPHQEMEVEGIQKGEEVTRDPSVDQLLGQYPLKF
ncbi:unnamed protein product [Cyclocybe aegerita]|uniref:Uncharacterized protein n=1 Tax=Cyclocybe aegerita TaxID=1973307 RepID=A0A8S0WEX6_CYCAE|nr:unnamed protein product [Cyclocybe aegerita]